jgi:hypothetical protein
MSLESDANRLKKGSFSFYDIDLEQLEVLARERRRERETDLQKRAMHIGTLFVSIEAGPTDRQQDLYGNWESRDMAEEIRRWVIVALDWLERHGHALSTSSSSQVLTSILSALATNAPQRGGSVPSPTSPQGIELQQKEEPDDAFIGGSVLSSLNLDESPLI